MHNTKLILTMLVTMTVCVAPSASAQTLFSRPDTTPNYAKYQYIDQCLSAIDRLTREADYKDPIWRDTAHYDLIRLKRPLPANAITAGQACLARFNFDTINTLPRAREAGEALLKAARDDDALRLYRRLMDAVSEEDRQRAIFSLRRLYEEARPMRVAAAKELHERWLADGGHDSLATMMQAYHQIAEMTKAVGDTASARRAGWAAVEANDRRPVEERNTGQGLQRTWSIKNLLEWLTADEAADSVSRSTASYGTFVQTKIYGRLFGDTLRGRGASLGRIVPDISGDFMYRFSSESPSHPAPAKEGLASYRPLSNDQRTRLPVPGRINAVTFLNGGCHEDTRPANNPGRSNLSGRCWEKISTLRRLKHKFPDLEITVVTHTFGSLGSAPPFEPAREADTLAKFFLGFHRIPGTLVVSTTPYFRLAGFDNRRVDEPIAYEENFYQAVGKPEGIYLVDETGAVFYRSAGGGNPEDELIMERLLRAVYSRVRKQEATN